MIMNSLWLEFVVEKFVEEKTIVKRCGLCQGGYLNPAICAFICMGIPVDKFKSWYFDNQDRLRSEWKYKNQLEKETFYRMMKELEDWDNE